MTDSTDHGSSTDRVSLSTDARRLATYLRNRAREQGGEAYLKSKFVADEVDGLSPRQIGALMHQLQQSDAELRIEQWANARATTWRVRL